MAERGSVLLLMPTAVLVVLVLGALAVDLSVVHLAEREVVSAASAAANDAVTHGLDEDAFYSTGLYSLDPAQVAEVVRTSLAAQSQPGRGLRMVGRPRIADSDGDGAPESVTVTVTGEVGYIFAPAIPGAPDSARVEASATATARRP